MSLALNQAIYSKLSGDSGIGGVNTLSTGGIDQVISRQGAGYPRTIFRELPFVHGYSFRSRVCVHGFYNFTVQAVDPVNTSDEGLSLVDAIVDRLIVLFTDPTISVSGSSLLYCRPDRTVPATSEWDQANNRNIYYKGIICELWLTN